jgi:uncharacterized protein (UPF0333 family)
MAFVSSYLSRHAFLVLVMVLVGLVSYSMAGTYVYIHGRGELYT